MPTIKINDAEFYYELHGQGQPLIFISGYGGDHQRWLSLLDALTPHFQVLLFDNRGAGQTTDDGRPLSAELMANDVMMLCETLQLHKPHIAGHSMGGTIAQEIAVRYPTAIGKLMILNSTAQWRQAMLRGIKANLQMRQNNIPFDIIFNNILGWAWGEAFLQNPEKVEFFRQMLLNNPYPQSVENQARQFEVLTAFDGRAQLAKIKAPTLVVYGNEDLLSLPSESAALAQGIAGAQLVEFNCGHIPSVETKTEFLNALLSFLI